MKNYMRQGNAANGKIIAAGIDEKAWFSDRELQT